MLLRVWSTCYLVSNQIIVALILSIKKGKYTTSLNNLMRCLEKLILILEPVLEEEWVSIKNHIKIPMSGIHHLQCRNPVNQLKGSAKMFLMHLKIIIIETNLISLEEIRRMEIQRKILFIPDTPMEMGQTLI